MTAGAVVKRKFDLHFSSELWSVRVARAGVHGAVEDAVRIRVEDDLAEGWTLRDWDVVNVGRNPKGIGMIVKVEVDLFAPETTDVTPPKPDFDAREELLNTLTYLDALMESVKDKATRCEQDPYELRTRTGEFEMVPLVTARAQVVCALAALPEPKNTGGWLPL